MPDLISQQVTTGRIQDNAITLGKLQDLQDMTVMGRAAGTFGDPQQVILSDNFVCDTQTQILSVNNYDAFKTRIEYFEDCFGAVTDGNAASPFVSANVSGTGAAVSNVTVTETGIFGVWSLDTGTTSTGRSALFSGRSATGAAVILGQGLTKIKTKIKIPTLSSSGERYKLIFGLVGDSTTATVNDGVYFEYDEATTTNWRVCSSNDGTRTQTNINTAVSANNWVRLEVVVNEVAGLVNYYINGSAVFSATTNIPTGTADPVSPVLGIFKTNGSGNRTVQADYIGFSLDLSSERAT